MTFPAGQQFVRDYYIFAGPGKWTAPWRGVATRFNNNLDLVMGLRIRRFLCQGVAVKLDATASQRALAARWIGPSL